jgi:ADP-ribose pyrophosphatase YjhB (NUDIX family)
MRTTVFGRMSCDSASVRAQDVALVPDEAAWAAGFATTTGYTENALDEFGQNAVPDWQTGSGPRLHAWTRGLERISPGRWVVPGGCDAETAIPPMGHHDIAIPTSTARRPRQVPQRLQRLFAHRGWARDQHGRCLHPFWEQLIQDARIGLHTGLGSNRSWGEAVVANAVVVDRRDQVLLIRHSSPPDSATRLTLPGGYALPVDEGVAPTRWWAGQRPVTRAGILRAASRHVAAATGQVVPADAAMAITAAARPVTWSQTTANAWTVEFTVLIRLPRGVALQPRDGAGACVHPLADLGDRARQVDPRHRRSLLAAATRTERGIANCTAGQR